MVIVAVLCAGLISVAIVAAIARMFVGPDDANRALGSDLMFYSIVALFGIGGVMAGSKTLFDVLLVGSTVGFLATLALTRAIMRGRR